MGGERFDYSLHKDDLVRVFWQGRCVLELKGGRGRDLAARLGEAEDDEAVQRLLRRATGNFRRGNERR